MLLNERDFYIQQLEERLDSQQQNDEFVVSSVQSMSEDTVICYLPQQQEEEEIHDFPERNSQHVLATSHYVEYYNSCTGEHAPAVEDCQTNAMQLLMEMNMYNSNVIYSLTVVLHLSSHC